MTDPVGHDGDRFVKELPERFNELGSFIREQRSSARLSLRRLSELAGISNPYLSQIERGLRKPSAEILQQIARGLAISAETLYERAGILDHRDPNGVPDVVEAIHRAPDLDDRQKQALIEVYHSMRRPPEGGTFPADGASEAGR